MMELQAGTRVYYQAAIIRESHTEIRVLFPGGRLLQESAENLLVLHFFVVLCAFTIAFPGGRPPGVLLLATLVCVSALLLLISICLHRCSICVPSSRTAETKHMSERREWVDKRSSRIWRGRLESRYWRYIKGLGGQGVQHTGGGAAS